MFTNKGHFIFTAILSLSCGFYVYDMKKCVDNLKNWLTFRLILLINTWNFAF